jgi:hypothetical protein
VSDSRAVTGPLGEAGFSARLFAFSKIDADSAFAVGPALSIAGTGKKVENPKLDNLDAGWVGRVEMWVFWLPASAKPANLRVGVAPFIDLQLSGNELPGSYQAGVLAQLRFGAPLFLY